MPADELNKCRKSSDLWSDVITIKFSTIMRVHLHGDILAEVFFGKIMYIRERKITVTNDSRIQVSPNVCQFV